MPLVLVGPTEPVLASLLALALMAVVTGAPAPRRPGRHRRRARWRPTPARAERARKDPAVGAGGVVALVLVLGDRGRRAGGLATAAGGWLAGGALVVAAVRGSRTVPVVAVVMPAVTDRRRRLRGVVRARRRTARRPSPRPSSPRRSVRRSPCAASSAAIASVGVVGAAVGLVLARAIVARRRQLDGDGLGAIVELTVAAVLVVAVLAVGVVAT